LSSLREGNRSNDKFKKTTQTRTVLHEPCGRCGLNTHANNKCPAIGSQCNYCKKPGHWRAACRKRLAKQVNTLQEENNYNSDECEDDVLRIYTNQDVNEPTSKEDKWQATLTLNGQSTTIRIDTGAKCNTLVKSQYIKLGLKPGALKKSGKILRSYTNHHIHPIGTVTLPITHMKTTVDVKFEVVDLEQENVISGDVAEQLGLIQRMNVVHDDHMAQFEEFPDLVKTTGTLPGTYKIKIDSNAKGVIHGPRRQPASLKRRIIEELHIMEKNGYITRVEEPTEWVSSMVVSLRKNKVRICIDPGDLNNAIKREHHPMKTVEEVVSEIPEAKVFSVLDAKSGFLQIVIDHESSLLTTFNTPIGRYRWLRLPFGIKSAPEIYQRIMDQMLEGIEGATSIMDDILVAGRDTAHHDEILKQVIERATQYNLKMNFDKCMLRQARVPYVGHILTANGLEPDPEKIQAVKEMAAPQDREGVRRFLGFVAYLTRKQSIGRQVRFIQIVIDHESSLLNYI
jgi:hypothetical protein